MYNLYSILIGNNNYIVITLFSVLIISLYLFKVHRDNILIISLIGLSGLEWYFSLSYLPFLIFINGSILFLYFLNRGGN